uniref:Uncharacterized protein n=1 Tax=Bicyclus anynana TaxID=110368 RepID=A0A1C9EGL1_BICAN|nr:hypothetical protein [Bicyclus anynana]
MKIVFVLLAFVVVCQARHIHPGYFDPEEVLFEEINNGGADMPIEVYRHLQPSRFVPLNSAIFFKSIEPCEDGFKRDVLGICREVWD